MIKNLGLMTLQEHKLKLLSIIYESLDSETKKYLKGCKIAYQIIKKIKTTTL